MSANVDATISLIIPVYNCARTIEANLRTALAWIDGRPESSELLVVDDHSEDETLEVIRRLSAEPGSERMHVLANDANRGKGFSVRRAMHEACGAYRVFIDDDLTYPIENVDRILSALDDGADVAVACRVHEDSRYRVPAEFLPMLVTRHYLGRTFSLLARVFLVGSLRDTQAGLKGFTASAAERLFSRQTMNRFSFDLEVLVIARQLQMCIHEVGVDYTYCKEPSTIHFVRDSVKMLRDMTRIRMNVARGRYRTSTGGEDEGKNEGNSPDDQRFENADRPGPAHNIPGAGLPADARGTRTRRADEEDADER